MTDRIDIAASDLIRFNRGRLPQKFFLQAVLGAAALAVSVLVGKWMLYAYPVAAPEIAEAHFAEAQIAEGQIAGDRATDPAKTAPAAEVPEAASTVELAQAEAEIGASQSAVSNPYGELTDHNPYGELSDYRSSSGFTPVSLAETFPLQMDFDGLAAEPAEADAEAENVAPMPPPAAPAVEEGGPLPTRRPAEYAMPVGRSALRRIARQLALENRRAAAAPQPTTPSDNRNFFEKLLPQSNQQSNGPALAYAAPEGNILSGLRNMTSNPQTHYDRQTAVYDVSAHTVYLPNGTRLEAHSGLGDRLDDPRHVNERMRGATPPNVYELEPRGQPFHGVAALRLKPVGNGEVYGRAGLLAHTYMLGPRGESNGCVSFKNYNAFLQAYQSGEIKRLAVVAHQD